MKESTTKMANAKKAGKRTIDQLTLARQISQKFGIRLSDVSGIIEEEQKLTMEYARMGYKVIKKNYLTIEGRRYEGKKNWKSPLNGKTYDLAPSVRILVRPGIGFRQYVSKKKMPEKLCRFVSIPAAEEQP